MNSIWIPIIILGIFTFLMRFSFLAFSKNLQIHPHINQALKYIPLSVLAAIIVPEVFNNSSIQSFFYEPRFLAGVIAIIVAWRTKNVILTITVGMGILYLVKFLSA